MVVVMVELMEDQVVEVQQRVLVDQVIRHQQPRHKVMMEAQHQEEHSVVVEVVLPELEVHVDLQEQAHLMILQVQQ